MRQKIHTYTKKPPSNKTKNYFVRRCILGIGWCRFSHFAPVFLPKFVRHLIVFIVWKGVSILLKSLITGTISISRLVCSYVFWALEVFFATTFPDSGRN